MATILAACPSYDGKLTIQYHRSFIRTIGYCNKHGIHLAEALSDGGFTSRARNQHAAHVFYSDTFTHLLTIDADMGWPAEAIGRLLDADKDIVGCSYPARVQTVKFVGAPISGEKVENGFVKAHYIGAGLMLVKKEVIVSLANTYSHRQHYDDTYGGGTLPLWDLFPSGAPMGIPGSEANRVITDDIGFCRLAAAAGYTIWLDLVMPLTHTGPTTFDRGPFAQFLFPEENKS